MLSGYLRFKEDEAAHTFIKPALKIRVVSNVTYAVIELNQEHYNESAETAIRIGQALAENMIITDFEKFSFHDASVEKFSRVQEWISIEFEDAFMNKDHSRL